MRGVFSITDIEWVGWADGPSETSIVLTKGADLPQAELVPALKEMLEDRFGRKLANMTVASA